MACSGGGQRRVVVLLPNHHFVDLRTPNSPSIFVPVHLINPSFVALAPRFVHSNSVRVGLRLGGLFRMEAERSVALLQFMADERLVPSPEEEIRRKFAIDQLKQIVQKWIKRVAYQRRLPRSCVADASATILPYGSYGLGVHNEESDMDALCVGPHFATMAEDFFIVLHNMLASRPEVSEIHSIKDAKVPLMRFKFNGISIDLPFAQLKVQSVPENVDILNPVLLTGINETSWRSLSGVRANSSILRLVPNIEIFQSLLRCVKLWAKRRGVYGNLLGFFGGVHLAVLTAFICQRNPDASLAALLSIFFKTFALWPWPTPVVLLDGMTLPAIPSETRFLMPIQLPSSPNEYCHSNITTSTFYRIKVELLRGHNTMKDLLKPGFEWSSVFERFHYLRRYSRFVQICVWASDKDALGDWAGWIKARFRSLILKLEEVQGFCDPNPSEYVDTSLGNPNVVFYWGLQPGRSDFIDVHRVEADFMRSLSNGYYGPRGGIRLSIVHASQLPKEEYFEIGGSNKAIKASWRDFSSLNDQKVPVYSKHMPNYVIGYLATDRNPEQDGSRRAL